MKKTVLGLIVYFVFVFAFDKLLSAFNVTYRTWVVNFSILLFGLLVILLVISLIKYTYEKANPGIAFITTVVSIFIVWPIMYFIYVIFMISPRDYVESIDNEKVIKFASINQDYRYYKYHNIFVRGIEEIEIIEN